MGVGSLKGRVGFERVLARGSGVKVYLSSESGVKYGSRMPVNGGKYRGTGAAGKRGGGVRRVGLREGAAPYPYHNKWPLQVHRQHTALDGLYFWTVHSSLSIDRPMFQSSVTWKLFNQTTTKSLPRLAHILPPATARPSLDTQYGIDMSSPKKNNSISGSGGNELLLPSCFIVDLYQQTSDSTKPLFSPRFSYCYGK